MRSGFELRGSETFKVPKGRVRIILQEKGQEPQLLELENVVVTTASVLIARLMKESPNAALYGAQYLAMGVGAPDWDPMSPPPATVDQVRLENEVIRKAFSAVDYIDAEGNISVAPTNILDLTTVFDEGEAVAPLVEMGLVGGNATAAPYTGYLINYRTFKVINKPSTATLTIVWRLTF